MSDRIVGDASTRPSYEELQARCQELEEERNRRLQGELLVAEAKNRVDQELGRAQITLRFVGSALGMQQIDDMIELALETVVEAFECETAAFLQYDAESQSLKVLQLFAQDAPDDVVPCDQDRLSSHAAELLAEADALLQSEALRLANAIICPIVDKDGHPAGLILAGTRSSGVGIYRLFDESHLSAFSVVVSQIGSIWQSMRLYQQVEEHRALLEHRVEERTAELRLAKQDAEEANQAKSAFLASMSHEIRTPMNAILGFSEILAGSIREGQQREFLDAIRTSGKSLLGLINNILDLSKVEAGKLELEFAPCDASAVSREMTQIFGQKAEEKGIEFLVEIDDSFPPGVVLDELRLRQILINLIGNAIKFTAQGHVALRVSGSPAGDDAMDLVFDIADTGVGIPLEQLDSIFNAFEQTKGQSAAKFGGTGLGLAISKKLSQMMGGDIHLSSTLDEGSVFSVQLHGIGLASEEALAQAQSADDPPPNVSFEAATILVVDDVPFNRLLIRTYLAEYGFDVIEAEDGQQGFDRVRSDRPTLVLTDFLMPEMDGVELTMAIRDDEHVAATPVVAVTASAMKEQEEELQRICDGFLRKPVSKAELVRMLMKFLTHQTVEDASAQVASVDSEVWSADAITDDQRAELAGLVTLLEAEEESWQELSRTLTINDVELFASRIQEEAHRFGYVPITQWGERLASQASMFDVGSLPGTLAEYSQLIDELKGLSND